MDIRKANMKLKNFLSSQLRRILALPITTRLVHTFWQSFLAVWLVNGFALDKVVLTAAVAAGLSAAKTCAVQYFEGRRS